MCQCLVENFPMHLVKCACPLCISSFSGCGLSGPQLATVQPAIGNRTARSWKTGF
ncbi:hypothetical protein BACSTE_02232 [Bacteroides stercoris ATCC 43183]|uniref:Uncharacterized protein n=1 Tax=Bacteroides stercoris ATCC 43183 TaxID=449673 RepID=B0NRX0_BACSE|nr:hypothetical protein BACSTE_02232 [Bacteroides stercoris ATCC 43183]